MLRLSPSLEIQSTSHWVHNNLYALYAELRYACVSKSSQVRLRTVLQDGCERKTSEWANPGVNDWLASAGPSLIPGKSRIHFSKPSFLSLPLRLNGVLSNFLIVWRLGVVRAQSHAAKQRVGEKASYVEPGVGHHFTPPLWGFQFDRKAGRWSMY